MDEHKYFHAELEIFELAETHAASGFEKYPRKIVMHNLFLVNRLIRD